MAKRRGGGGGERGGCLWRLADFVVLGLIAWAVAWFGPWKETTRPLLRGAWERVPPLVRPRPPAPTRPPAEPAPEPSPLPEATPSPEPLPSPTPSPVTSPTPEASPSPEPAPVLEEALARLQLPRLDADQAARAERVRQSLGGFLDGGDAAWRDNLACAADPEKELRTWERIASSYDAHCAKHPALPDATRREIFQALLMATMVPADHVPRYVHLKVLSPAEVRGILRAAAP